MLLGGGQRIRTSLTWRDRKETARTQRAAFISTPDEVSFTWID
jgi:hypothetical protein